MKLSIIPVRTEKDLDKFIKLPWQLYKGNRYWVPPLIKDLKESLDRKSNPTLSRIDFEMFLALNGEKAVGRIYAGIDLELNKKKGTRSAFFSLFECIESEEVSCLLFDNAIRWLRERGMNFVSGPVSPTGADGDDNKGLLIDAFDRPPALMTSYNQPYYARLIEKYGFKKDSDLFAYFLDTRTMFAKDPAAAINYAKKKYNFRVDPIDIKNIEKEIADIKYVMDLAVPDEWPDLVAPSIDEIREMAKKLIPIAVPELIIIARSESRPIGFGIALPDYNQVLIHLNGRITPLAALKYLWYKKKIDTARFFVMFVIPEFRKKGVSYSIYHRTFIGCKNNGIVFGEGSTIGETNTRMRSDIENFGGEHYKTYRIYGKEIL